MLLVRHCILIVVTFDYFIFSGGLSQLAFRCGYVSIIESLRTTCDVCNLELLDGSLIGYHTT